MTQSHGEFFLTQTASCQFFFQLLPTSSAKYNKFKFTMAVDPRFERLPEHEGPAFRTWQLIMQTTMGSVVQQSAAPAGPILNNNNVKLNKSKFAPAEDFISLNTEKSDSENGESDNNKNFKKKKEDSGPYIPWKTRDHYPENPVG